MRSLLSKEKGEKRRKRNTTILGVFLVIIMLSSTIGYAFFSSDQTGEVKGEIIEYNGIEFEETDYRTWRFNIETYEFETRFNPEQTRNMSVIMTKTLPDYQNEILYFGVDSEGVVSQAGSREIFKNIGQFVLRSNFACMDEECEEDYPIKNCSSNNIILFKEDSGYARIRDEEGCVSIYANNREVERASDAFLFKILGIQ